MCVVSMVMDHYNDRWPRKRQENPRFYPTQEELDEFRRLLERAREYDKKHNEPDCELAEKRAQLQKLADELGVKIDFV